MDSLTPKRTLTLPTELWFRILTCLLLPIPLPNSNPNRSLIRQQALTVTALVCKSFNLISVKLLYKDVCTDRLDLFLTDSHAPSRQKLFAHTRSLFVEYREREVAADIEITARDWEGECEAETNDLTAALKRANKVKGGAKTLFPLLTKVAVSSIYGGASGRWKEYEGEIGEQSPGMEDFFGEGALDEAEYYSRPRHRTIIDKCNSVWGAFIAGSNVKYICIRNLSAPLVLTAFEAPKKSMATVDTTIHISKSESERTFTLIKAVVGAKTRWSWEAPNKNWQFLYDLANGSLRDLAFSTQKPQTSQSRRIHIDIYCSTDQLEKEGARRAHPSSIAQLGKAVPGITNATLSLDTQQAVATLLGKYQQDRMQKMRMKKDVVQWHCAADAPICLACGTGPPV